MATNGSQARIPLRPGMYAPVLTIFAENEDLDLAAQASHTVRLAEGGLVGLVAMGSNGEAVHLTHSERVDVIKCMRSALDGAGFGNVPVIAGCSAQSVRESVMLCHEAAQAGASYALNLPPCYYRPSMTPEVIFQYFTDVADQSPIPVMMYNYPGAVAGIDMDSDLMARIARHPNIAGAKFTCANTGKLTRLAAATDAVTARRQGSGFLATGGLADMTIPTAVSGGSGIIAGSANVFPRLCTRVWDLWHAGKEGEALELQQVVAKADFELAKGIVPATKATLQHYFGYGGRPRKPLAPFEGAAAKSYIDGIAKAMAIEATL